MEKRNSYDWLLDQFGPLLTLDQAAKFLRRTPNAIRKSSCEAKNPLHQAKRKIGRRAYFSARDLGDLADGNFDG